MRNDVPLGEGTWLCRNCAATLANRAQYCHVCGQETALHAPTFLHFAREWIEHYLASDGSLWRTLKALAFRPGFLSTEYFAGRRQRYVRPCSERCWPTPWLGELRRN